MTVRRISIDLDDVRSILLECAACGSTVGFTVEHWRDTPHGCPNCGAGRDVTARSMYEDLRVSLQSIARAYDTLPFRVRLEIDGLGDGEN